MTVRYHPFAEIEFGDAVLYYERQQSGLGERFFRAVVSKVAVLESNPQTGRHINSTYREILVDSDFPYLIVYIWNPDADEIFISSVFHSKRHPARKLRKR